MLIALEGLDAAGKFTQSKLLAERLNRNGHEAVVYSFPRYDTPVGATIKRLLTRELGVVESKSVKALDYLKPPGVMWRTDDTAEALVIQCLMTADKAEVAGDIRAHLRAGRYVVCDRWTPSAQAFGASDGIDRTWLRRVQEPLPEADLYLLLTVSEEETLRRRPVLRDRYEKDRAKQKTVRAEYETLWREHETDARWRVIDGEGPDAAAVHARIWREVCSVSMVLG
jgi:dTMP kinase